MTFTPPPCGGYDGLLPPGNPVQDHGLGDSGGSGYGGAAGGVLEHHNIFCFVVFGLCIVFALLMGCKPGAFWNLLRDPAHGVDFSKKFGKAAMLMNVGLYGLFIVLYYNIIGATFNAVTFGCIFCMLACCNSGSNPKTVWPIMIGYVAASYLMGWLAGLAGGTFAQGINAQAIVVGLCFANGLSPISGKYGWPFGILAGASITAW